MPVLRDTDGLRKGSIIDKLAGTVLQHVVTAVVAVDGNGWVAVYNPAAALVLGVAAEAVVGRDVESLAGAPSAFAALAAILREARVNGLAAARCQIEVRTPAGHRTLGYTLSILGEDHAAALFFSDITDALAEERHAAEAQRFAEVGRIASAMAHELRSPLATVELYANLLVRALADQPVAVQQLGVIKDQTRRCLERINAIMHSINPGAARMDGTALTPLIPLVRSVVAAQRRCYPESTITFKGVHGELSVALGMNDLRSVVGNLIVNALEVTGGRGPVDVSLTSDADRVRLRIADKGPGLPDGDVFAAFYSTKSSGTGLGLWLVRRLVEEAGGIISAGPRRGGGAVFDVELPLPRHERLRGARLLVVEDDESLRAAAVAALEVHGAAVTAVGAGRDVPNGTHTWSCAILDYHLPDLTGVEIAARLPVGTPILVVSGDPVAGVALGELQGSRAWYLPKPFAVETYLDLVSLLVRSP